MLLDASIVNVALTDIAQTFGSRVAGLQWIVNAYALAFASLLMTGGSATGSAIATSISPDSRSSSPRRHCAASRRRSRRSRSPACCRASAARCWCLLKRVPEPAARVGDQPGMGCGGIAMASGADRRPADPSVRVAASSVNLPLGLAGIWLGRSVVRAAVGDASRHFDWGGGRGHRCDRGPDRHVDRRPSLGWRSVDHRRRASVVVERVHRGRSAAPEPMLPLAFFRNRLFAGSTFVSMASAFVFYGLLFVFSLFYRQVRGAALDTGLAFLPMTAMVALGGLGSASWLHALARAARCARGV